MTIPSLNVVMARFEQPPALADRLLERHAVVQLALIRDVAEGIEVREGRAVEADLLLFDGDAALRHDGRPVLERRRGVDRLLHDGVVGERDDLTGARERERLLTLRRGDQVGRPALIVFPPAPPVRELFHPPFELLFGRPAVVHRRGAAALSRLLCGGDGHRRDQCRHADQRCLHAIRVLHDSTSPLGEG